MAYREKIKDTKSHFYDALIYFTKGDGDFCGFVDQDYTNNLRNIAIVKNNKEKAIPKHIGEVINFE